MLEKIAAGAIVWIVVSVALGFVVGRWLGRQQGRNEALTELANAALEAQRLEEAGWNVETQREAAPWQ